MGVGIGLYMYDVVSTGTWHEHQQSTKLFLKLRRFMKHNIKECLPKS